MRMHVSVVCVCVWKMHNCSFKWKLFTHWTLIYLMLLQQKQQQEQLAMAATCTHTHTCICKCKYVCVCVCGLCRFINILSTWLCFMRNYSSATDCYFRRGLFCVCPKGNFLLPLSFYLTLSPSVAFFNYCIYCVYIIICMQYFSLLQLICINIFQHFLYLPWHFIAFLHISFICSIM